MRAIMFAASMFSKTSLCEFAFNSQILHALSFSLMKLFGNQFPLFVDDPNLNWVFFVFFSYWKSDFKGGCLCLWSCSNGDYNWQESSG
jgi:hypothetical protein